jgi:hypothetical protein
LRFSELPGERDRIAPTGPAVDSDEDVGEHMVS